MPNRKRFECLCYSTLCISNFAIRPTETVCLITGSNASPHTVISSNIPYNVIVRRFLKVSYSRYLYYSSTEVFTVQFPNVLQFTVSHNNTISIIHAQIVFPDTVCGRSISCFCVKMIYLNCHFEC